VVAVTRFIKEAFLNYSDPSSWHPAANIFPLLSGEDLEDLVNDIASEGLHNPIVLYEQKVLDGRNRLLACLKAGVEPKFTEWDAKGSTTAWVISQNLRRRQLTPGQKAAAAVEAKPLLEAEAKAKQEAAGKVTGLANAKANAVIKNDKSISLPKEDSLKVQKTVSKQFDVSEGYVYEAQKIKDMDEQIFQSVKSGALSIPEAKQIITIKEKAPELATKVLAGTVTITKAQDTLGMKQTVKSVLSSESNEWYTPAKYVEAAREVMGGIDLDPASSKLANTVVKAKKYFTEKDDGLSQKWFGRVLNNPPYGDLGPKFVAKLIDEYENGEVSEAVLLVNPRTDAAWFQNLFDYTLCFTDHRIKFWKDGGSSDSPTQGSVFVYLGMNKDKFSEVFGQFGAVVAKAEKPMAALQNAEYEKKAAA
jgi:hypothetical protein